MKKRRSTVYVRPGKDVTLYIPSDTPPEVIDYLNQLKQEGIFSQGIMDILIRSIQEEHSDKLSSADELMGQSIRASDYEDEAEDLYVVDNELETVSTHTQLQERLGVSNPKRFSLEQIFQQARHNSNKI